MANLVLLSDRSLCIIFSTDAYRRDSVMVRERDWQSSVHGFESTEAVRNFFSISFTHLILPVSFGRDYHSYDVQLSAMFKLTGLNYFRIFLNLFMHAFIQSASAHVKSMHRPY